MSFTPIAIVGQGCVLPGALNVDALCSAVLAGRDLITTAPADAWPAAPETIAGPDGEAFRSGDRPAPSRGGFVVGFDGMFDPDGFRIPAEDVMALDRSVQWLFDAARQAVREAGYDDLVGQKTAVVLGNNSYPTNSLADMANRVLIEAPLGLATLPRPDTEAGRRYWANRFSSGRPAHLLAQALGGQGPAFCLDAACASSLYAVKLACDHLADRTANIALAGGFSGTDNIFLHLGFSEIAALSASGMSRPFNRHADGLLPAEGSAVLVLKRLDDAVRCGDRIHGVIRGIGLSNDGRRGGLLAPDRDGQITAMRRAYASAALDPAGISLLECHATGTPTGDRTELESARSVFGAVADLPVGSLKSNLGHLITASGAAAIIKVNGAMAEGLRPATLHAEEPLAEFEDGPLRPLLATEPWPDTATRRAGISNFGFGGNNAHLILEEYCKDAPIVAVPSQPTADPIVVCGVGLIAGDAVGFDQFAQRLFATDDIDRSDRIANVEMPIQGIRFPPSDLRNCLGQQTAVLSACGLAVDGIAAVDAERSGVIIGMGCDVAAARPGLRFRLSATLEKLGASLPEQDKTTLIDAVGGLAGADYVMGAMPNLPANRVNIQHDWRGLGYTVADEELSGFAALEIGARALRTGELDMAVVGAVDLCHDDVHCLAAQAVLPAHAQQPADAAIVLVLKRKADAEAAGDRILATVEIGRAHATGNNAGNGVPCPGQHRFGHAHAAAAMVRAAAILAVRSAGIDPKSLRPDLAPREAATVSVTSFTGQAQAITLKDIRPWPGFGAVPDAPYIFFAAGDSASDIRDALSERRSSSTGKVRIAIVASSQRQMEKRIADAARLMDQGRPCMLPGVHVGDRVVEGDLAFVYPGTAACYPGAAEDLALAFPEVTAGLRRMPGIERVSQHFGESGTPLGDLTRTTVMVFVAMLGTRILRDHLGLKPTAAIGLSVGEVGMLVANDVWPNPKAILDALEQSGFYERLTGDHVAITPHLDLPAGAKPDWENYEILAPVDRVEAAIAGVRNVWITVVSSPAHCSIGGTAKACAVVTSRFDQNAVFRSSIDLAFHGPFTADLEEVYRRAHSQPVVPIDGLRLYSNATHDIITQATDNIVDSLSQQLLNRVDVRPTIEKAWADGVRVFVDVGPRNTLVPAISAILGDRPHLAVGIDRQNRDGLRQLAESAGALFAAGLPVDLTGLAARLSRLRGDEDAVESLSCDKKLVLPAYLPPVERTALEDLRSKQGAVAAAPALPEAARVVPLTPLRQPTKIPALGQRPSAGAVVTMSKPPARNPAHVVNARAAAEERGSVAVGTAEAVTAAHAPRTPPRGVDHPARSKKAMVASPFAASPAPIVPLDRRQPEGPAFDRTQLEVLAGGKISSVFGPLFEQQDAYARQCRMPEPPLLLADRVLGIAGEPGSMGKGVCWTETDIAPDAWYLHNSAMPTGVMIEAGQADLLLISWLGADFLNRGDRIYRLLGCEITFHDGEMPRAGDTIGFQIQIDSHAELNGTRMFFFRYDARIGDRLVSSVRNGQAGFFTDTELANSGGVLWSAEADDPKPDGRVDPMPSASAKRSFTVDEVRAFAGGDAYACFGDGFEWLAAHQRTPAIPAGRMQLIDGASVFDPAGGPWGRGYLKAEYDVPTDAWFYDGHFKNDPCMPGTLMAEAATQALALHMAALGLTHDRDGWVFRPVTGEAFKFVCRGQVVPDRPHKVSYEVFVEEIIGGDEPTVFAALLASSDGHKVFLCRRFGLKLVRDWPLYDRAAFVEDRSATRIVSPSGDVPGDLKALMACAWGRPSDAFGTMYRRFDDGSSVPRLPGPPYHCVSRIVSVDCEAGVPTPGGKVVAEFDVDPDAWYFADSGNGAMPFSVLSEVLLQPCGWLASYMGFALAGGLKFRNLDGSDVRVESEVTPETGTLTVEATFTKSAVAGPMTIVFYEVVCHSAEGVVLSLRTDFGFFPPDALASQKGLPATDGRRAALAAATAVDPQSIVKEPLANDLCAGSPTGRLAMVDTVTGFWPEGGKAGLGRACGRQKIDPTAWYFKAHFYEDPVQPGSLGLEALFNLLKAAAKLKGLHKRFATPRFEAPAIGSTLGWKYRGQVIPTNKQVLTEIDIVAITEEPDGVLVEAEGSLWVDGLRIYEVSGYALRVREDGRADRAEATASAKGPASVRPPVDLSKWTVDAGADDWLNDHCPTYCIPVYPMMAVVADLLNSADRGRITCLADVELSSWIRLDQGPVTLASKTFAMQDGRTSRQLFLRTPDNDQRIGRAIESASGEHPEAPAAWTDVAKNGAPVDPYRIGDLFHFEAFQLAQKVTRTDTGSRFVFDAAEALRRANGHAGILLDLVLHGIPHNNPGLWFGADAAGHAAFPYRLERLALFARLPCTGEIEVVTRAAGMPTPRTIRSEIQVIHDGRVIMEIALVEALMPVGVYEKLAPAHRRAFGRDRVFVEGWSIATVDEEKTTLSKETVREANWLPGTLESLYAVADDGGAFDAKTLTERIAVKDHFASRLCLHPSEVSIDDAMIFPGNYAPTPVTNLNLRWDGDDVLTVVGEVARVGATVVSNDTQEALLFKFRYQYFVLERGILTDVADHENMILRETADDEGINIVAVRDGEVVGSARINWASDSAMADYKKIYRIEDFTAGGEERIGIVTRLRSPGGGALFLLLKVIVGTLESNAARYVLIDASVSGLSKMYQSMGFRVHVNNVVLKYFGPSDVLYLDTKEVKSGNSWYRSFAGLTTDRPPLIRKPSEIRPKIIPTPLRSRDSTTVRRNAVRVSADTLPAKPGNLRSALCRSGSGEPNR